MQTRFLWSVGKQLFSESVSRWCTQSTRAAASVLAGAVAPPSAWTNLLSPGHVLIPAASRNTVDLFTLFCWLHHLSPGYSMTRVLLFSFCVHYWTESDCRERDSAREVCYACSWKKLCFSVFMWKGLKSVLVCTLTTTSQHMWRKEFHSRVICTA